MARDSSFPGGFPTNGTQIEGVDADPGWVRVTSHGKGDFLVETRFLKPR